jgi:hypothetical protein
MDDLDRAIAAIVRKPGYRPVVELVDEAMVPIFAAMSGAERLALAFSMAESARSMLMAHLRSQHPSWNEGEIEREAARRLSHGAA